VICPNIYLYYPLKSDGGSQLIIGPRCFAELLLHITESFMDGKGYHESNYEPLHLPILFFLDSQGRFVVVQSPKFDM
jgi:hypothetical protein